MQCDTTCRLGLEPSSSSSSFDYTVYTALNAHLSSSSSFSLSSSEQRFKSSRARPLGSHRFAFSPLVHTSVACPCINQRQLEARTRRPRLDSAPSCCCANKCRARDDDGQATARTLGSTANERASRRQSAARCDYLLRRRRRVAESVRRQLASRLAKFMARHIAQQEHHDRVLLVSIQEGYEESVSPVSAETEKASIADFGFDGLAVATAAVRASSCSRRVGVLVALTA